MSFRMPIVWLYNQTMKLTLREVNSICLRTALHQASSSRIANGPEVPLFTHAGRGGSGLGQIVPRG